MHEVSLMRNLLETVEEAACRETAGPVKVIHLRIGELAGVNMDALSFAFDILKTGTVAQEAKLEFERVALEARCKRCGTRFHPDEFVFRCRECDSVDIEILTGREMQVDFILLDDEIDGAGGNGSHERNE
jgi:hydrogenase nickel incorporation protein HypA/HybF